MYKKAERLAKATHLITPAFAESVSLKNRIDAITVGLIDAAILAPAAARVALSHELLTLSSVLSIARTSGLLSPMNAELIAHETHALLQEIAAYEEPRLSLEEAPTLSNIAKGAPSSSDRSASRAQGRIKDIKKVLGSRIKDRQEIVLSVIRNKGTASIKDISTLIRTVSEKAIQRELQTLVEEGKVHKRGERRWSTYSLA